MKYLVLGALTFLSFSSFANQKAFELSMDLSIGGKHVASPHVVTRPNETSKVFYKTDGGEFFLEVIASDASSKKDDNILMNFVIGQIDKDGQRKVLATPQIITGKDKAEVTVGFTEEKDQVSLAVVARKTSL